MTLTSSRCLIARRSRSIIAELALALSGATLFCGAAAANPPLPATLFPSDAQNRCAAEKGTLDLSNYHMTFSSDFQTLDTISVRGPDTTWIAHTPNATDFGDAPFANPGPGGPYSADTSNGLKMSATETPDGHWQAALISSANVVGLNKQSPNSFTQQYGYFEACMKLPDGPGVWPAFWLLGTKQIGFTPEIDVIEYYGGYPTIYHTTAGVWTHLFLRATEKIVPAGILQRHFNSYGVDIEPSTTTFYFNRTPYFSFPTPVYYKEPMYILADLALGGGFSLRELTSPQNLYIDYIRVWQNNAKP